MLWHVFLLAFVAGVFAIPPEQRDSLAALYGSTNGNFWFTKWNISSDPCTDGWFGVLCDASKNVTDISLSGNNLTGILPDLRLPALTNL